MTSTVLRAGNSVFRLFRLSNHRWFVAVFAAFAVAVGTQTASAAAPIEIRLLREPRVGADVLLESIGQNVSGAHLSWKLEQRPKLSRARISDHNSTQTFFRADVPGLYIVRVTARLRNLSLTATLDVTATEPGPLVKVDTIDLSQGAPAISIGSQSYADPGNGSGLHVVAVNRNTLELVYLKNQPFNNSYSLNSNGSGISQMQSDLATLPTDGSVLVLVSLPASAGTIPSNLTASLSNALNLIGGVLPQSWNLGASSSNQTALQTCWSAMVPQCWSSDSSNPQWQGGTTGWSGSFSVIGVPGLAAGNAWYDDAQQDPTRNGALTGYLTPGAAVGGGVNGSAYVFVFGTDQYVPVDTCASVAGLPPCTITVGSQNCSPTATNGMNLMVLDRVTLNVLFCGTVTTTAQLYSSMLQSYAVSRWPSGHFFQGPTYQGSPLSDRIIVILQSVGTGQLALPAAGSSDTGTALLQAIDQLGGTPETFGQAIGCTACSLQQSSALPLPQPYALVGVASNLPWHGKGVESSPIISNALGIPTNTSASQTGRIRAVLSRDRYARYTPTSFDPIGTATLDLASVIYQPLSPWPFTAQNDPNTPAYTCAIQYIAEKLGLGAYPDFRSAYVITDFDWDSHQPNDVPFLTAGKPPSCPGLPSPNPQQFSTVQSGLQSEVGWLGNVNLFIEALATPFVDTGSGQNTISQVAANIYQTLAPPSSASTSTPWGDIFDLSAAVGSVFFPNESNALGVLASTGTIAVTLMSSSSSGSGAAAPAKTIIAEAVNLSTQLYNQTQAHLASLGNLQVILVSDYGKLSAVGDNTATTYRWTNAATTAAIQSLNATTQQTAYSAMLPVTWKMVQLKPDLSGLTDSSAVSIFYGSYTKASEDNQGPGTPFYNITVNPSLALSGNVFTSLFQLTTGKETSVFEAWTFNSYSSPFNGSNQLYASMPNKVVTGGTLFSTGSNGGAAYPPAWYRSTFIAPQWVRCGGYVNATTGCTDQHGMFIATPPTPPTPPPPIIGPVAAGYTSG